VIAPRFVATSNEQPKGLNCGAHRDNNQVKFSSAYF
jgi:hypothetical protein